ASGGSTNHRPAQEKARKRPNTVANAARAGHNLSQNKLPRARLSARASRSLAECSRSWGWLPASSKRRSIAQTQNLFISVTRASPAGHARILALKANPACDRAQLIGQLQGVGAPMPIPRP